MPKAQTKKKPKVEAEPTITVEELQAELNELRESVTEAFEFGANELRPLFGQSTLALVFDGIAKGLRKKSGK